MKWRREQRLDKELQFHPLTARSPINIRAGMTDAEAAAVMRA